MKPTYEELQQQLAAAVAENVGLKEFVSDDCWIYDTGVERYRDAVDYVPETPAADAYLAEVRAQGVERMIEVKQKQLDGMHPDTFAIGAVRDSIRRDIYELKVFAEILRQESQLRQGAEHE